MEMCRWLFQGFTEIKNGHHGLTLIFLWAQITYARDFSKILTKIKMAARGQLQNFLCAQKLKNLKSAIMQILQSHFPRYGDMQMTFF